MQIHLLRKVPQIEEEIEKNDPFDLPDNVSEYRYEKVYEKYEWLSNRIERTENAIEIYDMIGNKKGGHNLTTIDPPCRITFIYQENYNTTVTIDGLLVDYTYSDFRLSIGVRINNEKKYFRLDHIGQVAVNEKPVENFYLYLKVAVNKKVEEYVSSQFTINTIDGNSSSDK